MHAISAQITPSCQINRETQLGSPVHEGITEIEADTFVIKSLQTLTGVKFLLSSEPNSIKEQDQLLTRVYEAYADFVSKNPFQENEMPIKSDLFENQISAIFGKWYTL